MNPADYERIAMTYRSHLDLAERSQNAASQRQDDPLAGWELAWWTGCARAGAAVALIVIVGARLGLL